MRSGSGGGLLGIRSAVIGLGRIVGAGLSSVAVAAPVFAPKESEPPSDTPIWVLGVASMILVLLGGAFAGLTIAYVP